MSKFKYRERTAEDAERRASGTGEGGVFKPEYKTWTPEKGDNFIRILPATWEDEKYGRHYGLDIWVHYGIGPNRQSILCLAKNLNQRCPICDERNAGRGPSVDKGERDPLMPTRRVAVWMVNMKEPEKGPMIWAMAQTLDKDIVKVSKDKETGEFYIIDHPERGYNVNFEKEGEQRNTNYVGITISRRPNSVPHDILDYIAEHPLPDTLQFMDYDAIREIYEGGAPAASGGRTTEREPESGGWGRGAPDARERPAPGKDRAGWGNGSRTTEPPDDAPPPTSEADYGQGKEAEPETEKPSRSWGGPKAAGSPTGRPSINPRAGASEAPAAEEQAARNPSTTGSSLRDRFAARNKK